MRPSVRPVAVATARLRPSRPAVPFVCARCQPTAHLQSSSPSVRFSSSDREPLPKDKLPFSEKVRRRMWGTDNPPGQKDPYSRASPEEMKQLWAEEERLVAEEEQEKAEKALEKEAKAKEKESRGKWLGWGKKSESPQSLSEPATAPTPLPPSSDDAVATNTPTSDDLEALGYVPATTTDGLMWVGGKTMRDSLVRDYMDEHPFQPYMAEQKARPADTRPIVEWAVGQVIEGASGSAELAQGWESYDISKDGDLKFALIKTVVSKTGRRIPDPAIARFRTAGDIAEWLEGSPVKPMTLAQQLSAMPALQGLPNVKIHPKAIRRHHRDVEFGRAKVIVEEQRRRGLL